MNIRVGCNNSPEIKWDTYWLFPRGSQLEIALSSGTNYDYYHFGIPKGQMVLANDIHLSWDPYAPKIWDNFSIFRTNCAILTSFFRAVPPRVVGSRTDVAVTFRDQMVRVARFPCGFFTAMAENKAGKKHQISFMYFYTLS